MKKRVRLFLIGVVIACLGTFLFNPMGEVSGKVDQGTVCLYFDQTGPGDLSFNDMAMKGARQAANQFGLQIKYSIAESPNSFLSDLRLMSKSRQCKLIIGVGFLLADALPKVAREFPEQKFAFVDQTSGGVSNILGLLFEEQKSAAQVGVVSALGAIYEDYSAVGIVAGAPIPPVWRYEAGFRFGVHWALQWYKDKFGEEKKLQILSTYVGSFNDPAGGKQAAETQLASGAFSIFGIAGETHLGAFSAVEEKARSEGKQMGPPFAFGADAAQEYVKPGYILASSMKRVDVATYKAVKQVVEGTFEGGTDLVLGLAEGGVGLSSLENVLTFINFAIGAGQLNEDQKRSVFQKIYNARTSLPAFLWQAVTQLKLDILSGEIKVPEANTTDQIKKTREEYP